MLNLLLIRLVDILFPNKWVKFWHISESPELNYDISLSFQELFLWHNYSEGIPFLILNFILTLQHNPVVWYHDFIWQQFRQFFFPVTRGSHQFNMHSYNIYIYKNISCTWYYPHLIFKILFRNSRYLSPFNGLVIKSSVITSVGKQSIIKFPFSTWSVRETYRMFKFLVLLLKLFFTAFLYWGST